MRLALLVLLLTAAPASAQSIVERARHEGAFVAALGNLYAGDADAAAAKLETLLETRPDDAAVLDALAEAYAALDRPEDALYHAQLAADATDRPEPRLRLAALQAERGDLAAAAASYEAATVVPTADPAPLITLAEIYAQLGQARDERRTIERLLNYGDTSAAQLRLATLAEADDDATAAARHLTAALHFQPGDPDLLRRLATARDQLGDADGAAIARARADALDPAASLPLPSRNGDDTMTADDALAALTAALNRADGDPAALPDALALADRALDLAPQRADDARRAATSALAGLDADDPLRAQIAPLAQ